ncbi:MAG: ATP-binding protein [Verrucomicrobiota bacterium]
MNGTGPVTFLICLLAFCFPPGPALPRAEAGEERPGLADRLARLGSRELRGLDQALAARNAELARLPAEPPDAGGGRIGWHSPLNAGRLPNVPQMLEIDLGAEQSFDAVVLVAASGGDGAQSGLGYGFPLRFTVAVSREADFKNPVPLADFTAEDFPNPEALPVFLATPGAQGRYLRITATKLFRQGEFQLCAMGGVMVLKGKRDIAAGCAVTTSGSYRNSTAWNASNLTDGQTVLGPPVTGELSPGHGFHSAIAETGDAEKQVSIDLGRAFPLEEVRLFPARPRDFPVRRGFGFPVRFRLEAAMDDSFANPVMLADFTGEDFQNPGENPVTLRVSGITARLVRITATRLWMRYDEHDFVFALSEAQVFSGGENVALGRPVLASDNVTSERWKPALLTDGCTSQYRLADWPDWLRRLSRRREVRQEIAALRARRPALVGAGLRELSMALLWILLGIGLLLTLGFLRYRRKQQAEIMRLRLRIASDLHDDIGSNLGSIMLLSRLAGRNPGGPGPGELEEIHRVASETAESMRDIVWLIQPGKHSTGDLVSRMRETARGLLTEADFRLTAEGVSGPLPLDFQRQIFLLFKEAVNNIRKHAAATAVSIRMQRSGNALRLVIEDNGQGFSPDRAPAGHGLGSMKKRAEALRGTLKITSSPGGGTRLELNCRTGGLRTFV